MERIFLNLPDFLKIPIGETGLPYSLAIVFSLVPVLLLIFFYRLLDRKEPEPRRLIVGVFFSGFILQIVLSTSFSFLVFLPEIALYVLAGPVLEELFKALVVVLFIYKAKSCNQIRDGFIYGATLGAGYALAESMARSGQTVNDYLGAPVVGLILFVVILFLRLTLTHSFTTGIFGYFAARRKFLGKGILNSPLLGLFIATIYHMVANALTVVFDLGAYVMLISLGVFILVIRVLKLRSTEEIYESGR